VWPADRKNFPLTKKIENYQRKKCLLKTLDEVKPSALRGHITDLSSRFLRWFYEL